MIKLDLRMKPASHEPKTERPPRPWSNQREIRPSRWMKSSQPSPAEAQGLTYVTMPPIGRPSDASGIRTVRGF
jgi:hypothetical protein